MASGGKVPQKKKNNLKTTPVVYDVNQKIKRNILKELLPKHLFIILNTIINFLNP